MDWNGIVDDKKDSISVGFGVLIGPFTTTNRCPYILYLNIHFFSGVLLRIYLLLFRI